MSGFSETLGALVSKELAAAHGDPERMGVMIERLLYSSALVIAMAAKGDAKGMETFLLGAESYLYDSAATHAKLARFMSPPSPQEGVR